MSCVRPPLLKKPSRGFAWSCAACSRAQERLLEARHTPNVIDGRTPDATGAAAGAATAAAADDDELLDDDDEDGAGGDTGRTSPDQDEDAHPPATAEQQYQASLWPYRYLGIHCKVEDALDYDDRIYPRAATRVGPRHQAVVLPWPGRPVEYVMPPDIKKATRREARQNKEALAAYERERESRPKWIQDTPAGYIERGQDYDDDDERNTAYLLYKSPNAPPSVPPAEKPAAGAADADAGSADCKMDIDPPETKDAKTKKTPDISDEEIDQFMDKAVAKAAKLGVPPRSTNLHDVAADLLFHNNFNTDKALKELDRKKPDEFREPILNAAEYKRFEDAVTKFGSELHLVTRHVKTVFYGDIVRYYYAWKKSERGKIIWGNNASRKGKKEAKEAKKAEAAAANKIQDDVADDVDDSAFDTDKADALKRQFQCKFCSTKTSRQWRRAPAAVPTGVLAESLGGGSGRSSNRERSQNQNTQQYVAALCRRCSELWRRYAVQWEDVEALTAKVTNAGGRLVKRKLDDELMKEIAAAEEMIRLTEANFSALHQSTEPPRKRLKGQNGSAADKDADYNASDSASSSTYPASSSNNRRRDRERANAERAAAERDRSATAERASGGGRSNGSTPAVGGGRSSANAYSRTVAELLPEPKKLPCAVCLKTNLANEDQRVVCRDCRLTVHRSCYGVLDNRNPHKWLCDMCTNDRNPHMSINYNCVLCPVEHSKPAAGAQTSSSHSKRSDAQGRERDRIDREQAKKADEYYRKRQEELNKPVNPREALKRTADNNWIHVTCAVWTPEIKFGRARALEPAEGVASVPRARYDEQCKICKTKSTGACVSCNQCRAQFHVQCAHQAGYIFGFDLVPVKGSRRDQANIVTLNGVNGLLVPAIWCRDHIPLKSSAYLPYEKIDGSDMSGLQFYVENYKQADLALTGCARKANLLSIASKMSGSLVAGANSAAGRGSSPDQNTAPQSNGSNSRQGSVYLNGDFGSKLSAATATAVGAKKAVKDNKVCLTCGSDVSPKWHAIDKTQERELANGFYGKMGEEAQKFVAQRNYQCHKCKKTGRKPSPHSHDREMHDRAVHGLEHVHREQERAQEHELARGLVTEFTSHPHGGRPNPQASPHTQHHHHRSGSSQGHIAHSLTGTPSQSRETEHRSTVVKREEEPYSDDMQRLAPRYPPESDLSRPPPSQSQLHQAPPLLPAHQQPLPPPSQSLSQPQTPSQLPPRAPSSHHHNILHPVDHARPDPPQRSPYSHAQQLPASTHPPSSSGGPPTGLGSSRSPPDMAPRYWSSNMGSSGAAPPPPPPLPQQAPPPLTSIRPGSSRGTPSPHTMHSAPHMQQHHSPHSMSVPPRSSVSQQAPPAPVHPYSSSSYSDWRRPPTSSQAPPPPPPSSRREPLHSASTSNSFTHNHLRPPPLSGMQNSGSSGGEYMGQSVMNGRPPSPPRRSLGGPPPPLAHERNSRDPYGHSYGGHAPYGTSHGSSQHSPQMQSTSPHHPFAQMLHPQRSASSNASFMNAGLNTNNVTREDFTLRGPANNAAPPPPRPSEPRNGSSASSNPSLRNLLS
ncbi:PHD finger and BAH domain protein (Snt2) [Sporothrix schenckii 1099-18]|uniref:PHD finger and BAH domain protein (Snt2) n=1 Tax=Sporothrix schenckii 1099-18 TaxID=1397361 RepID=A0A0F2MA86_SPOSC|nr:PHD finger and BAH domain protein (Snt2) [Sporothrix schenckii 1099-18]KJR85745.1 PHD finger and BAH domain protein (Snt2) [Sporothrix schenckii 1099-18]